MYSPRITSLRLFQAKKAGLEYTRLPRDRSIEISSKLEKLRFDSNSRPLPDGNLSRAILPSEQDFINSELTICKCDFEYWFTRYCHLARDPGVGELTGIGPPVLLESQRRYITLLGRREEECTEEQKKYKFTEGILAYFHKVRQVAATATARALTLHRMIFWPGTRCLAATLDDSRISEIFTRDQIIIGNLPFWMKPRVYPDVKDTEIGFEPPTSSRISYQSENQSTGIGTGSQNDVSHLTEVALWKYPGRIRFSFVPSIPKAITTLHIQESTPDGKGDYWHEVTESARHRRRGYESWIYAFIPWYMNRTKYRANPPLDWQPEPHTIRHAELVERTSPEFTDGVRVQLSVEQLYWWETTRAAHASNGELSSFLTNYAATPEQSFQAPSAGALPVELIELMEQEVRPGLPYEIETAA